MLTRQGERSRFRRHIILHGAFRSVPAAIAAAGAGEKRHTREEMIEFLRKLDKRLGRAVMKQDIQAEFRAGRGPSDRAVTREFGGLVKAA